ncbi:hypothetical protein SAMN05877842_112122 [Ureibacillus acetophenoni]|uniref:Uncharacterized protein n=1 Tax=Ureibacillus acetophenoni TaxID=614649 RepID=A0A285UM30_9BACL|nr:hypothetical protein SAMN05877842_112122 [Ureibacillus acetophenoni]
MYFVHEYRSDAGDAEIRRSSRFEIVPMEVGGTPCESRRRFANDTADDSVVFFYAQLP